MKRIRQRAMKRLALLVVVILSAWSTMAAQVLDASRYEQRTLSWGGGAVQSLDTYLSPLLYRGAHVAILSERFSQMPAPSGRWFAQSLFFLHGDYALAAEGRGLTVGGMADYSYTLFNRLPLGGDNSRWTLCAGAQGQLCRPRPADRCSPSGAGARLAQSLQQLRRHQPGSIPRVLQLLSLRVQQ